jgi:hypothetical protein
MIHNLCDFILNYFKEQGNLDNIVRALFPNVLASACGIK